MYLLHNQNLHDCNLQGNTARLAHVVFRRQACRSAWRSSAKTRAILTPSCTHHPVSWTQEHALPLVLLELMRQALADQRTAAEQQADELAAAATAGNTVADAGAGQPLFLAASLCSQVWALCLLVVVYTLIALTPGLELLHPCCLETCGFHMAQRSAPLESINMLPWGCILIPAPGVHSTRHIVDL